MGFKYTVVTDTMFWIGYNVLETPQEVLEAVKEAGYDGIDLPGDPKRMDGKKWRKMVKDVGLDVPELLGAWGYYHAGEERNLASPDQAKRGYAVQYAKDTVDLAAEIGARFVELCAAQPAIPQLPYPDESISILREHFKQSICEICEHAARCGITILLEPLNCYEGLPGVLTTVIEAVNYVEELKLDNLGVQPDNYHMNVGEASIPQAVRRVGKHIKHYHFNETNHMTHGTGHANFREIVRILKEIGYDDYLAFYMPQTSQRIFCSAPGVETAAAAEFEDARDCGEQKSLLDYLSQPLRLLKEIERTVDLERDLYELDATRY
jgi:D-psicose/D-tagatose/L-ribulose 3-epimerase